MWIADGWKEYQVLDASGGEKLEQWGDYVLLRPDPQVIWNTEKKIPEWRKLNAHYHRSNKGGGDWEFFDLPKQWDIHYKELTFHLQPFSFKHTGLFPEQAVNWDWFGAKIAEAKKENPNPTAQEKKELTAEEKDMKSKRKQIQEKLIKFATRIPVFMYLTDYRERCLKDVITQLEPGLFKKVTGLSVKDFNMLCSLGVFNAPLMNDAIFKFKRYEDASLTYTGIDKHANDEVGGWDTTIRKTQYEKLFYNQQYSITNVDYSTYTMRNESIENK